MAEEQASGPTIRLPSTTDVEVEGITLLVEEGLDAGASFHADSDRMVIGSHHSAQAVLTDPSVSRFHCELGTVDGKVHVRDLGSTNGTFVDGVQIEKAFVARGQTVRIGGTTLRLQSGEPLRIPISPRSRFQLMLGQSPAIRRVFAMLEKVAQSNATVLLLGETGTGKEVAAESLHRESPRSEEPFVVVDCGAIPEDLLETELFGHEKGAFTGAVGSRDGAFGDADGGTVFLDEIGELPLALQPKLLRVLERKQIRRVGSSTYRPIDVRVLAATHRDLRHEVNAGRFREDLYYRLAVVEVRLPPLRERLDDLPFLLEAILAGLDAPSESANSLRTEEFLAQLEHHDWPGNVRELRNYVERCLALREQVPIDKGLGNVGAESEVRAPVDIGVPFKKAKEQAIAEFEARYLAALLEAHDGKVREAAAAAGIDRVYAYRLLRRYGIK